MLTASFFTFTGAGRISIARFAPRGTPKGFRVFKPLAPGPWFNSVSPEEYLRLYRAEMLDKLDPQQTWDLLHDMASGEEPVLLCWERPTDRGTFCHRAIVARWFKDTFGFAVSELGHEGQRHPLVP